MFFTDKTQIGLGNTSPPPQAEDLGSTRALFSCSQKIKSMHLSL